MTLVIAKQPLSRIRKWSRRALFCCAALFLGYCGFNVVDAWIFQRVENRDLDRLLREKRAAVPNSLPAAPSGGLVGRISIPRLLLSAVVLEGIGKTTLRRGVGHIPGTA